MGNENTSTYCYNSSTKMITKVTFLLCCTLIVNGVSLTNEGFNKGLDSPGLPLYYLDDSAYYFQTFFTATQEESTLFCKNLDMGLVSIESKRENDFLFDTIGALVDYEISGFWTSGLKNGKIWYWMTTGKPFSYTHWGSNVPKNESKNCLEVIHDSAENTMSWSDADCIGKNYVICEGDSSNSTTSAATRITNSTTSEK